MAQGALVDVVRGERDVSHGVTAHELLNRREESRRWISASALERWLIESGFAEPNGEPGRLVPTNLAIEVAGALDFLARGARCSAARNSAGFTRSLARNSPELRTTLVAFKRR